MAEFDPSDHNLDEVHAHLEKNPSEAQAVLDAEKAGKNRSTLVSELEEQLKSVPQPVESAPVEAGLSATPTKTDKVFDKDYEVTPERGYRRS